MRGRDARPRPEGETIRGRRSPLRGSRRSRTPRGCRAAGARAAPAPRRFRPAVGGPGMIDDGPGRENRLRLGQALHARGDVHRLPEIILAFVEHDREARTLMEADLQQQILLAMLGVESPHRLPHAQRRGHRAVRCRKRRHHGVADRLDDGAGLGGDDLVQHAGNAPAPGRRRPGRRPCCTARSSL